MAWWRPFRARQAAPAAPEKTAGATAAPAGAVAPARLAAPPDAPFTLVAVWHDRLLLAAPPGADLRLGDRPLALAGDLIDVDLLSDPAFEAVERHWATYHDEGHAHIGRDVSPDWQLADSHTAFLRLSVADRGRIDPVDAAFRDGDLGEALPVAANHVRVEGLVAAHRAVAEVRVEMYDAGDRRLDAAHLPVDEAAGGRHPEGFQPVGAVVALAPGTAAVRLKIVLTPFADADDAFVFFSHLRLAATQETPRRPLADRLCALAPLLSGLAQGELVLRETALAPPPPGAAPQPVTVVADGRAVHLGHRAALEGTGRVCLQDTQIVAQTGRFQGRAFVLADGEWIGNCHGAPSASATRHVLPAPDRLFDARHHRLELVSDTGRLAVAFASAPRHATPWSRIVEDVMPPVPGFGAPLAEHRYRAFVAHAARAAAGRQDPWTAAHLPLLHDALVAGPGRTRPFALRLPAPQTPDVSVVVPVHERYDLTFVALAALAFAPVETSFEVIVVDDGSGSSMARHLAEHEGLTVVRHDTARGFLHAANAGAQRARGRHIVLLNNDTEVTAGWLDALREAFDIFPGTGVAGARLIYPDGTLQDAGGRIDHHGDPTMVGRGGNAHDPRYAYAREVDYVSGAALMIEAELWRAVGGFSEAYAPAYFEDVDLCFKAREAGRRVMYVPASVVVHSEGGSHGTDLTQGVKQHQSSNAPVFKRTWAHRRPPPLPAPLAHDRGVSARVLFVLLELPRTDVDAASVAAQEEIALIQALGAKVTVLPRSLEYLPRYAEAMQRRGVEVIHAPFATSMEAFLEARGAEFDAVFVTRFQVAEALLPAVRRFAPQAKVLLNLADLHFLRQMRAAAGAGDEAALAAAKAVRARELATMRAADVVLSYSDVEGSVVFSHAGPEVKVARLPWVQRVTGEGAPFAGRAGLAFLGNYRHPPNIEAVAWFAGSVMPLLAERAPHITFTAYGAYAEEALAGLAGVELGGHVADLSAMFDRHRLFVAPLRSGAGVKGKVFEAMAAGLPCILTSLAAEGVALRDGEHALIADTAHAFAEAVIALHEDEERWQQLSAASRTLIETRYGAARGVEEMRAAFEAAGLFLPVARGTVPAKT